MAIAGFATGRLDREVLTQSNMSMRYRWEYWQGAWGVITEGASSLGKALGASNFWAGVGPGNFAHQYLLYKLPQASEEIQDPHNLFLEVWATAGFWALTALLAALVLGLWNVLGPSRPVSSHVDARAGRGRHYEDDEVPPPMEKGQAGVASERLGWIVIAGGLGLVMVLMLGQMNLFQGDLFIRWLVLVMSWVAAALLGVALWRRVSLPGAAVGAAVVAIVVNLLAAGGIGIPTVASSLWLLLALGLNVREDRPCGRIREVDSRIPGFAMSVVWSAVVGSFFGAITPFWSSETALAQADDALQHNQPDFEKAQAAYDAAKRADAYNPRPWLGDAYLQLRVWESRGARPEDLRWKTIPVLLLKAASPPRNPSAWTLHSERAKITRDLLAKVGQKLDPRDIISMQASIVEATRTASRLYPTNATLHARLAEASADVSMFGDAVSEATEALRLDKLLAPHPDKRLSDATRDRLISKLAQWTEKAEQFKVDVK
jgi:hypothetical protein